MSRKYLLAGASGLAVIVALVVASAFGAFTQGGASATSGSARAEGVEVHGHWTIVVRSKSGKVVSRHSFHNDFITGTNFGDQAFSEILSASDVSGDWDVSLSGTGCPATNGNFCQLFEPDSSPAFFASPGDTKNLTVTMPTSGADQYKIVLAGTVPATNDGTITSVSTGLQVCPTSSTVGADCGRGYNEITQRTLATPISVLSGQSIAVTVKISFG